MTKFKEYNIKGKSPYDVLFNFYKRNWRPRGIEETVLEETRKILVVNGVVDKDGSPLESNMSTMPSRDYTILERNLKNLGFDMSTEGDAICLSYGEGRDLEDKSRKLNIVREKD